MQPRGESKKLVAWGRWVSGAQARHDEQQLWDIDNPGSAITSAYCRVACKGKRCADCVAPALLPEAQPAVAAYMLVRTQWRVGFNGRTGLDYPACIAMLRLHVPAWRKTMPGISVAGLMDDLQIIETAMLTADNEQREQEEANRPK